MSKSHESALLTPTAAPTDLVMPTTAPTPISVPYRFPRSGEFHDGEYLIFPQHIFAVQKVLNGDGEVVEVTIIPNSDRIQLRDDAAQAFIAALEPAE